MLSTIFSTLAAKIAAIGVAAAAATGGVAATGSLPAPAQDAVATAFSHLGVHFPASQEKQEAPTPVTAVQEETEQEDGEGEPANSHGKLVSETARKDYDSGRERGEAVSTIASTNGQAHRSQNAGGPEERGTNRNPTGNGKPESVPPTEGGEDHPEGNPTGNGKPDWAGDGPPEGRGKP